MERSKPRAVPLIQFLKPVLDRVRVGVGGVAVRVGVREFLQQEKSLLGYPQQELLKVQRNAVLAHELIDTTHGQHAQARPLRLANWLHHPWHSRAAVGWESCVTGVGGGVVPVGGGHRLDLDGHLAAEAGEVENGGEERGRDGGGEGDPAKQVHQTFQSQRAQGTTLQPQHHSCTPGEKKPQG